MTKTKYRLNFQRFKIVKQVQHSLTKNISSTRRKTKKESLFQRFTEEIQLLCNDYSFMLSWNLKFFNALNWWPQKIKSALKYKKMKWASKVFSPLEILINEVQDFYLLR